MAGRDKSQLQIDGRTILERQVEALHGLVARIWLVGYRGSPARGLPVAVLADRASERGPLGGLDAALAAAGDDDVLLLACDLPNVTRPMLAHLIHRRGGADAVVPRTERGYHPLCAVYAQSCRTPVELICSMPRRAYGSPHDKDSRATGDTRSTRTNRRIK